jgi:hypothetical protein
VTNAQEWDRYLADFANRIQAPSEVAVRRSSISGQSRIALSYHLLVLR